MDCYFSNCDTPYVDTLKPFQRTNEGLWQKAYVPPLPQSRDRIRYAVTRVDDAVLRRLRNETAFRRACYASPADATSSTYNK